MEYVKRHIDQQLQAEQVEFRPTPQVLQTMGSAAAVQDHRRCAPPTVEHRLLVCTFLRSPEFSCVRLLTIIMKLAPLRSRGSGVASKTAFSRSCPLRCRP